VCEYAPFTNLTKLLGDDTVTISLAKRLEIALNIAEAMQYVTSHPELAEITHNNLKSSNILVSRLGDVKIIGITSPPLPSTRYYHFNIDPQRFWTRYHKGNSADASYCS
jgi:serine/threonine protein kinase